MKQFPELKNWKILTNELLIALEIVEIEKGVMITADDEIGKRKMFTRRGWVLLVGEGCSAPHKDLQPGTKIMFRNSVDINEAINVGRPGAPAKMVANPNAAFFTFKEYWHEGVEKEMGETLPTVLIGEWDVVASE